MKKIDIFKNKTMVSTVGKQNIIYFLINKDKVVYVGQSKVGVARIYQHISSDDKRFDSFSYIVVKNNEDLNAIEADYIIQFDPIYNTSIPSNKYYKSLACIKKLINIGGNDLNKLIRRMGIKPVFSGIYDIRHFPFEVI